MISIDAILLAFIKENWFTIMTVLGLLKILARESKTTLDDKILTYLSNRVLTLGGKQNATQSEATDKEESETNSKSYP